MLSKQLGPPLLVAESNQSSRFVFSLVILSVVFDLVRPSFVWHFPKIISSILILAWILKAKKIWSPQMVWYTAFLGVMGFDLLIAKNLYDAAWFTYGMFVTLVGGCIPLINFTDSLAKMRALVNVVLAICLYIAAYAISHEGYGPAGAAGGQDENYVAAFMTLAIPLAGFSFFAEKSKWKKVWFAGLVCLYILAIIVGLSRGGFVGLLCALGFVLVKSPKKGLAIVAAVVIGCLFVFVAGSSYWEEMNSITDVSESTADMRLELWRIAVREFMAYPLTGVGPGNYHWRIHEFQSADQTVKFGRIMAAEVHSIYFQLLAELGLTGCFVFGMVLLRMVRDYLFIGDLSQKSRVPTGAESDHPAQEAILWIKAYRNGLMGGVLGYLTSVAFLSSLYYSHLWVAVSMMSALLLISSQMMGSAPLLRTPR